MSPRPARRRSGVVALTCAGLTLSAGALGALGGTAAAVPSADPSADPVADCAEAFPVSEVAPGDLVDGLTVVSGTTPTGFTGEVLGVLEDGIAPDVDMIMIDLDMPAFAETGGVWQGMSGSPVYAQDGRLLGAVAYGLSNGPSKIAGITPFAFMDDYLSPAPTTPVRLSDAQARLVAKRADIAPRQAAQGFRELPIPFGVAGVSARRLAQAQDRGPTYLAKDTYLLGRARKAAPGAETMVAGGNMAASAAYGDITYAGVGTATSVCDGDVVGFGHPLYQLGETTEGLHTADAIYIQPDSLGAPFKVANVGPVVGTVTQDRLSGITGTFGPAPSASTVTSTVTYGDASRTGATEVTVPDALPDVVFYQLLANNDRVLGGDPDGTAVQSWTVTGDDDGTPFELTFTDRYTGGDLVFDPIFQVADLAYSLISISGVTIDDVTADTTVTDEDATHSLRTVEQRVKGTWKAVTSDEPVRARAGGVVRLRVTVAGSAGTRTVRVPDITVPRKAAGRGTLSVRGGNRFYSYFFGGSIAELEKQIATSVRHDQVEVRLDSSGGGRDGRGPVPTSELRRPGQASGTDEPAPAPASFSVRRVLGPLDAVVDGRRKIPVRIAK